MEHGYNIWIQAIDAGQKSYNLSINQPSQEQFVLTMWGASGIQYAATTDIMSESSFSPAAFPLHDL